VERLTGERVYGVFAGFCWWIQLAAFGALSLPN